jgi:hypothetical protein
MPLYFFHLSFGSRVVSDDEGVELRNRVAAREEALVIIRELSHRAGELDSRRWASWFLNVTDEAGEFLRLPIGHPALELVADNASKHPSPALAGPPARYEGIASTPPGTGELTLRALVRQIVARLEDIAQLLELNRELRQELSAQWLLSREVCGTARRIVSSAQGVGASPPDPPL